MHVWSVCMQFNLTCCNVEEFATQEANFTVGKQNDLGFVSSTKWLVLRTNNS